MRIETRLKLSDVQGDISLWKKKLLNAVLETLRKAVSATSSHFKVHRKPHPLKNAFHLVVLEGPSLVVLELFSPGDATAENSKGGVKDIVMEFQIAMDLDSMQEPFKAGLVNAVFAFLMHGRGDRDGMRHGMFFADHLIANDRFIRLPDHRADAVDDCRNEYLKAILPE